MSTKWDGDKAKREIREAAARGLVRAAEMFQDQVRIRVSKPNPPPYLDSSKPGEYPRLRTGEGKGALIQDTKSFAIIMRTLRLRVSYDEGKQHLLWLELGKKRLGFQKTLDDMKDILAELATSEFRK